MKTSKTKNIFATRLTNTMESNKCTQQRLAEAIGTKAQTISQYRDGSILPRADKLAAMADYFGVSCDYLIGKDACKTPINEEMREMIGLTEPAIEALKKLRGNVGLHPSSLATLETVSILLSTPEGMNVFGLLNNYLWANYSVGYKSREDNITRKNGISEMFFELTTGNPVRITTIPMETMRESILISLLKAVADMRPACETFIKESEPNATQEST